jgi:hypothetical protein
MCNVEVVINEITSQCNIIIILQELDNRFSEGAMELLTLSLALDPNDAYNHLVLTIYVGLHRSIILLIFQSKRKLI